MFLKISIIFIFQFLLEIGPCHSQGFGQQPTPPPGIVMQNCTQFSTRYVNWFRFSSGNQNCYYISSVYSTYDWFAANERCRAMNASLFSIHDYNTNYLLSHRETTEYYSDTQTFWTGLNSLTKRGVYKWTDNSPVQYRNFTHVTSSGDSIPVNYMDQGRCVSFQSQAKTSSSSYYYKKYRGGWFKEDCAVQHRYICQKSPVITVPTQAPPPVGNCPSGWFQYANQKCIKYMNVSMTFNQSRDLCIKTNGGEMLSIHSEEEQNFITAYTAGLPSPYIGLTRKNTYGRWGWDDSKPTDFSNWGIDNNNYNYYKYCSSIITNDTQPGKWLSTNCSEKHTVICEKPLDPSITTQGQSYATNKCKIPGFDNFIQYRNSCYSVSNNNPVYLSYSDAEKSCQAMKGSHLLSVVDPFEEAFLRYYIKQYGKSDMYWIGLQSKLNGDTNVSQSFEWTDDWPVYYTNWDKYEPQFAGLPQEECVLFAKSNGTWRTSMCALTHPFICKTTTNPLPKMNADKSGVCPTLKNVTDKTMQWVDIDKRSQYCYWNSRDRGYYGSSQSWVDAAFHCRQRKGTLVSIHSKHELLLLKTKFTNQSSYNTWIGLSSDPNGDYVWEDGSALEFTNWDPNEKIVTKTDLNKESSNRQCVEVKGTDAMWKQQPCSGSKRNYFICEAKKIYHAQGTTKIPGQTTSSHNPNQGSTKSSSSSSHPHKRTTKHHNHKSTPPSIIKEQHSSKNTGLTGGAKAGIAFGVIGGVVVLLAIGYFGFKRLRPNSPMISSFENRIYSSGRRNNQNSEPGVRYNNRQ